MWASIRSRWSPSPPPPCPRMQLTYFIVRPRQSQPCAKNEIIHTTFSSPAYPAYSNRSMQGMVVFGAVDLGVAALFSSGVKISGLHQGVVHLRRSIGDMRLLPSQWIHSAEDKVGVEQGYCVR